MLKKTALTLCFVSLVGLEVQARYLESYTARLGPRDHYNSRGYPLSSLGDILQQDRANYHRYGVQDPDDRYDSLFGNRRNRARIKGMLRRGWVEAGLAQEALYGSPLVRVDVFSNRLEVRRVPLPPAARAVPAQPTPVPSQPQGPESMALKILAQSATPRSFSFLDFTTEPLTHKVIGKYVVDVGAKSATLVVTASKPSHDFNCHACAPKLSFFLFKKRNGSWVLATSYLAALSYGQYGEGPESGEIKTVDLGMGRYGVLLFGGYSSMGWSEESRLLLIPFGDKMQEAIRITTATDNSGVGEGKKTDWKASYRFVDGVNGLQEIVVHREGIDEGKAVNEVKRYRLDLASGKYVRIDSSAPKPQRRSSQSPDAQPTPAAMPAKENNVKAGASHAPEPSPDDGFILPEM